MKDIGSVWVYSHVGGMRYEGEVSGVRVATTCRHQLFMMAVLSGARVVCALCVCVAAPCCWAACGCVGDASECSRHWLNPPGRASTRRFVFLLVPIRRDWAMSVSESSNDLNKVKS